MNRVEKILLVQIVSLRRSTPGSPPESETRACINPPNARFLDDWKTKVVDKYYRPGEKLDLGARAKLDAMTFSDPVALEEMVKVRESEDEGRIDSIE